MVIFYILWSSSNKYSRIFQYICGIQRLSLNDQHDIYLIQEMEMFELENVMILCDIRTNKNGKIIAAGAKCCKLFCLL